jgi:hypothetical protein
MTHARLFLVVEWCKHSQCEEALGSALWAAGGSGTHGGTVMVAATRPDPVTVLTVEEARAFLEAWAQQEFQVALDTFIERWRTGTYGDFDDDPRALQLAMLLPTVGVDPWSDGAGA